MKALLLLSLIFVSAFAATTGLVRVKVAVLDAPGDESPVSIVSRMQALEKAKTLNVGYPIVNLTVISLPTNSASPAPTTSPHSYLILFLLSCVVALFQLPLKAKWIVGLIAILSVTQISHGVGVYDNCMIIDGNPDLDMRLSWTISGSNIKFAMDSKAQGWSAIGISTDGTMPSLDSLSGSGTKGSDMMLGYLNPSDPNCSNGCVNDYFTTVYNTPTLDSTQDLTFVAASKANGRLSLEWSRPLSTGDNTHDRAITPGSIQNVIYAASISNVPTSSSAFSKHDFPFRGVVPIDFGVKSSCPTPGAAIVEFYVQADLTTFDQDTFASNLASSLKIPSTRLSIVEIEKFEANFCPDCEIIDLILPTFTIPAQDTTYQCFTFTGVTSADKQILRFEPVVDNSLMVHHMVIFQTPSNAFAPNFECSSMPNALPSFAWTPGQTAFNLPPEAGFPIGPTVSIGNNVVIQMHYNNPTRLAGQTDHSGIRFYVKPRNAPTVQDAGMIFFGMALQSPVLNIPANTALWHQSGECPQSTLSQLGSTVLTVFGVFHHMHELGRQIWLERVNQTGSVIETVVPNFAYDFNDQKTVPYQTTITSKDKVVVHCVWSSTGKNSTTTGGESTSQEMCLTGLLYYPAIGVASCFQNPTTGCVPPGPNCPKL